MKINCPSCSKPIPAKQLNVEADLAVCPECGEAFAISALVAAGGDVDEADMPEAPRGTWFAETFDGWTLGATTRSAMALFLVPFMCVWSGFSLGGIYGSQIVNGQFNLVMSLFGIPFLLGTLLFGSIAVMSVCGKVVISVANGEGRVFTGVGAFGWTRRFDWLSITKVDEDVLGYQYSGSRGMVISLVGTTRMKFGSMLSDARRYFLLRVLRRLLAARPASGAARAIS